MEEKKEGWKWITNSKVWHYFREGRSLCGRFAVFSMNGVEQGNNESEDNCKKCKESIAMIKKGFKIRKILSETQKEVLGMLTEEFETPKRIALRRGKSIQSVYKIINKLKLKGYLTRGFNKGLKKFESTKDFKPPKSLKGRYIRLHAQEWNLGIIYKSNYYEKLRLKNTIFDSDGNTIRLYRDSIEVYSNELLKFDAEDEQRATALSFNYWQRIFTRLENKLKITLIKPNYSNIKLVNHHYAEVNNEIAKEYNEKKVKVRVYTTNDGKLWFEIDHSWNLDEAETKHKDTAKQDMTTIKRYFNDMRDKKPPTNSELQITIGQILSIQKDTAIENKFYAENIKAHAEFVKEGNKLLKKLNNKLDQKRLGEFL